MSPELPLDDAASKTSESQALRRGGEELLRIASGKSPDTYGNPTLADTQALLHELEVHQVELKMQNEALLEAQCALSVSQARYFQLYELAPAGYCVVNSEGMIVLANLPLSALLGVAREALEQRPFSDFVLQEDQDSWYLLRKKLKIGSSQDCELRLCRPGAGDRGVFGDGVNASIWVQITARLTHEDDVDGRQLYVFVTDIRLRKLAEQHERFRSRALELLASNEPLADFLDHMVRGLEQMHPSMMCSVLHIDRDGRHLGIGIAPSLPDFYNAAIDGIEIGMGVGSCGTAAFTGERVIVANIETHPYWTRYKDLATHARLGACWSQPIYGSHSQVLGTLSVYHRLAHTPEQSEIHLIEQSANLIGIAMERQQAQSRLQLAASVFDHTREAIVITDGNAKIVDVNDAFSRITGYSQAEALGQNPRFLRSGRHDAEFYSVMWRCLTEQGFWNGEVWNQRKSGEVYPELLKISAVRDNTGKTQQYVGLFSDITTVKAQESRLEHIAHFDALTNLPNRLLLSDRLQQAMSQALRRNQWVAVVYLDLDGFKRINDRHGHHVGDQFLIALANAMKDSLREGDTLARLGGDEFVAVLIDLNSCESCMPMLSRLLEAAATPVKLDGLVLQGSASVGVTFYPQADDIEADQLLRQADQAMYQAKLAGKNRYHVFDAKQDSSIRGHHESLESIRVAMERHEFVLHYQPKVNMQSGLLIGAEALIRWQHPERGLLAPAAFLSVIEEHPLAVDVGEWVIDTVLTQIEDWHAVGLELSVSVNIGARQLQLGNFVERLQSILDKHAHVNAANLELEVLETSALSDIAQVSQVIADCARIGVKFALDDFGTGYSSLTYLKRLRVSLLKIDQSFVLDMLENPDDMAILKGVLGMAAAFNCQVIAEGVETVAHGTALLHLGCLLAQGYGIAKPMPAQQFPAWARTWRPDAAWRA